MDESMTRIIFSALGPRLRGPGASESYDVSLINNIVTDGSPTSTGTLTSKDTVFNGNSYPGYTQNLDIEIVPASLSVANNFSITNLTPSVANLSGYKLTRVTDGTVTLEITNGHTKKRVSGIISHVAATIPTATFNSYTVGSLRNHIKDEVLTRISGKSGDRPLRITNGIKDSSAQYFSYPTSGSLPSAAVNQYIFSNTDKLSSWVRNSGHILNGVDITGISAPRTYGQDGWNGGTCSTVISPQHIVSANHWHLEVGRTAYFVTADNQVISRVITSGARVGSTDIWIGHLDSPLPASITPLKVLPSNFATYLPDSILVGNEYAFDTALPCYMVFNSTGDIHLLNYIFSKSMSSNQLLDVATICENNAQIFVLGPNRVWMISFTEILSFGNAPQVGSGSPVFTIINGSPVVLFCLYIAGYSGPGLHYYVPEINATMTTLHGSAEYQLQHPDLSAFTAY